MEDDSLIEYSDIMKNKLTVIDLEMEHTFAVTLGDKLTQKSGLAIEFKFN